MEKRKIFRLVNTLLPSEYKTIRSRLKLEHPAFFRLLKEIWDRKTQTPEPEDIWRAIFPNQAYNSQKLRSLSSSLSQLIEEHFIQVEIRGLPIAREKFLLAQLNKRNLKKEFHQEWRKANQHLKAQPLRNHHYFEARHFLEKELLIRKYYDDDRSQARDLREMILNLERAFFAQILRYSNELPLDRELFGERNSKEFGLQLRSYLQNSKLHLKFPVIRIYLRIGELMQGQEEGMEELYLDFKNNIDDFHLAEAYDIVNHLINYCTRMINQGKNQYYDHLFLIAQEAFASERIYAPATGYIAASHYSIFATVGIRMQAYQWTWNFLKENKSRLNETVRNNTYALNAAKYHFARGDCTMSLQLINELSRTDDLMEIKARAIRVKNYYMQGEDSQEALFALLDSFNMFLRGKARSLGPVYCGWYHLFILVVRKLMRAKGRQPLEKIKKELHQTHCAEKEWLLDLLKDKLN